MDPIFEDWHVRVSGLGSRLQGLLEFRVRGFGSRFLGFRVYVRV